MNPGPLSSRARPTSPDTSFQTRPWPLRPGWEGCPAKRSRCQGTEWRELGGARLALPGLGSPQDRLPNPKLPSVLPSTPKPTSCPSLLPHTPPTAQDPAGAHLCPDQWGCISGPSVLDVTAPGDGPGQEVRTPFLLEPGGLSDEETRSQGAEHKIKSGFSFSQPGFEFWLCHASNCATLGGWLSLLKTQFLLL